LVFASRTKKARRKKKKKKKKKREFEEGSTRLEGEYLLLIFHLIWRFSVVSTNENAGLLVHANIE